MRRIGIFLLIVIALAATAGPAAAQPKVTISGFVDNISSYTHNISETDLNPARNKESEWYTRVRVRPDITAEVGTTKFVLGLEIDETFGQTGNNTNAGLCGANSFSPNGSLAPAVAGTTGGSSCSSPQRFGTTSGWGLNTDSQGVIEIKWAYTEFDVPLLPVRTRLRLGAQPFETQYKSATLATGDFAGAHLTSQLTPMVKAYFTYAQYEESSTGPRDGFIRGDDFAIIASVEITPFKGLDLRPIFSYANFVGVTQTNSEARAGFSNAAATYQTCPAVAGAVGAAGSGCAAPGHGSAIEDRFTVGLDARWRFGPFSLDPTVFYQFGSRDQISPIPSTTSGPGVQGTLKMDAWYLDLRGGWQAGPLLLEAAGVYTTGNKARDRIDLNRSRLKFYQPLDTDGTYFSGWGEIFANGIDFNAFRSNAGSLRFTRQIGYDKYGLMRLALRASYDLTPAFTLRTSVAASWSAEQVDTASTVASATNLTPRCLVAATVDNGTCVDRGTARYLGTELNLGFQWRFAPNVTFDLIGAYAFAGPALSSPAITNVTTGIATNGRNPQDMQTVTARVRYSF